METSSPDSSPPRERLLLVVRHAKAEPYAEEDHVRRLTRRGHADARAAGEWLAASAYVPTHAFVSAAPRAHETWEEIAAASGSTAEASVERGLYTGGPDSVLDSLRTAPDDAAVVAFVGHNPTAASLVYLLDDGHPDEDAFRALSEGMPTSGVAVLAVAGPWSDLGPASARLVAFRGERG